MSDQRVTDEAKLRKKIEALELIVSGLRGLNACYRIGTQRGASAALDRIRKGEEMLAALEGGR